MTTRRGFIVKSAITAFAACFYTGGTIAAKVNLKKTGNAEPGFFSKQSFIDALNSNFKIADHSGATFLSTLVEVESQHEAKGFEQFSIILRNQGSEQFDSGLYQLKHKKMGRFLLHLEKTDKGVLQTEYRAIFSRFA